MKITECKYCISGKVLFENKDNFKSKVREFDFIPRWNKNTHRWECFALSEPSDEVVQELMALFEKGTTRQRQPKFRKPQPPTEKGSAILNRINNGVGFV